MDYVKIALQLIVAFGLLNVWLMRYSQKTPYRGGNANTLKDEFAAYGLPEWFFYFMGILKIGSAILLVLGIWYPPLVFPTALLVSILMIGAITMHVKSNDPIEKSIPAIIMLLMSAAIGILSYYEGMN